MHAHPARLAVAAAAELYVPTFWFVQPRMVVSLRLAALLRANAVLRQHTQNADDAGARTISFCLDEQQHGVDRLAYDGLAPLQVP